MTKSTTVCVAGCGHWGKNLIRTFSALDSLYGVYDTDLTKASGMKGLYPQAVCFDRYEDLLNDPHVDAIVIASPAEFHYRMALDAIAAGKDVFVEKPLALDWQDGVEMTAAARRQGCILMAGHLLHYHPAIMRLKELVHAGVLGHIEYIYSNRLSMGKIRREENALWSFAPHDISVILGLLGEMPYQATATGGAYVQPNIADVTVSTLLFNRGTRAHIFVSWLHPYKEQKLVIIGSKQMAVFEDSRSDHKLMLFNKQVQLRGTDFEVTKPEGTVVSVDAAEPLLIECRHFLECVETRKEPLTPGDEGVRVLQVLQACQKSLHLNGEPVQVAQRSQKVAAL